MELCKGLITRVRKLCTGKVEKSVLDFFVVCSYVLTHVTEMIVDEDMKYAMTNFTQVPKGGKAVDSDHMTTVAKMKLNIVPHKMPKKTVYNLKNSQCQKQFKISTSDTKEFTSSLHSDKDLQFKCEKWQTTLDAHIKHSFRKMRIRKSKVNDSRLDALITKRNKLKKSKNPHHSVLSELETQISELLLKEA